MRPALFLLASGAAILLSGCADPPTERLSEARQALRTAARDGARQYAESTYREAEAALDTGWREIARQEGKLPPLRDYTRADSMLLHSIARAQLAAKQSRKLRASLRDTFRDDRQAIAEELAEWQLAMEHSLLKRKLEHHHRMAEFALQTADRLADRDHYEDALESLSSARAALKELSDELAIYTTSEAERISLWRRWVNETLEESRTGNTYAVIVDKTAHRTYLVRAGRRIHTFKCELGYNPARQKLFSGDAATPEGRYRVTTVKANGSKYYKALLLDYPNARDRARFKDNKAKGIISAQARIGGLIEIHGEGGRGKDWTEGCVALTNAEMDTLLRYAAVGMPVTIVRKSDRWP